MYINPPAIISWPLNTPPQARSCIFSYSNYQYRGYLLNEHILLAYCFSFSETHKPYVIIIICFLKCKSKTPTKTRYLKTSTNANMRRTIFIKSKDNLYGKCYKRNLKKLQASNFLTYLSIFLLTIQTKQGDTHWPSMQ